MYLFILLFIVYLIVTLTRSECMSAAGLRFGVFLPPPGLCKSLQNGCVYLFCESTALNTCVSEMRLIKFDELKKKRRNVLTLYLAIVASRWYLPGARRSPQDANGGWKDKQARVFLLFLPFSPRYAVIHPEPLLIV